MYDSTITVPRRAARPETRQDDFEAWCKCVRRLLDAPDGDQRDWRDLYASGHTPRDAARIAVYGDSQGD